MACDLSGYGAMIAGLAAVVAAGIACRTTNAAIAEYRRAGDRDRARLVMELFDRFYVKDEYRAVYLAFDGENPKLRALLDPIVKHSRRRPTHPAAAAAAANPAATATERAEAEWRLTAYLNFFETVATLVRVSQIKKEECMTAFNYPLDVIKTVDGMQSYLKDWNYDELHDLIDW
ncbi:MAG: hypothetical protein ACHREM_03890 [Polyangiales bacterium]